jgi:general secretion pathway protein C
MRRLPLDPARLVTSVLAVALGLQIAWMVTGALGARSTLPATAAPPAAVSSLEVIKAARLFGALPGAAGTAAVAPVTTQGLTLVGVLASTDPRGGRAIIGESGGSTRVYAVGATLPGGSRLAEVYPDRVILDRGGGFETLPLPRQGGTPAALNANASTASAAPRLTLPGGEDLANVIRWQAVVRGDRPSGVRVYPGSDAQRFAKLGLQAGDLILSVNDAPLADQANGEQFLRTLAGAPQARLTLERGGRTETVVIDLASALESAQ